MKVCFPTKQLKNGRILCICTRRALQCRRGGGGGGKERVSNPIGLCGTKDPGGASGAKWHLSPRFKVGFQVIRKDVPGSAARAKQ